MVIMELAMEAAQTSFSYLNGLPYGITLFQFGFCFLIPLVVSKGAACATLPRSIPAILPYIILCLVVFASTFFATASLKWCSYPTKVVFKSGKLIPTMIVATILKSGGGTYGVWDYVAAGLLCAGAAGYGYDSGRVGSEETATVGIILLTLSVVADAFTPNLQQRLMASPSNDKEHVSGGWCQSVSKLLFPGGLGLSAAALMVNVNAVGFTGLFIFMAVSGSLSQVVTEAYSHPSLLVYLTTIGAALGTAVLAYTRLIRESGSVMAVAVATLRKVVTVVLSYVVFPKPMTFIHVLSGLAVLGGVILSSYNKQRGKKG